LAQVEQVDQLLVIAVQKDQIAYSVPTLQRAEVAEEPLEVHLQQEEMEDLEEAAEEIHLELHLQPLVQAMRDHFLQ
jgi:malate/lactate dehydrogenase